VKRLPKRRDLEAESVDGRGMGRGSPPPQPTTGLGERCKLPQRGPEQSPG